MNYITMKDLLKQFEEGKHGNFGNNADLGLVGAYNLLIQIERRWGHPVQSAGLISFDWITRACKDCHFLSKGCIEEGVKRLAVIVVDIGA
jgi:hypothetical protein